MKPYFEKDGITIYHGDCREILPHVRADVMVTDPPYDIVAKGGGIGAQRDYLIDMVGFTDCGFDYAILSGFDRWMVFCALKQIPELAAAARKRWSLITWNKPDPTPLVNGNYLPDTEYIIHSFRSGSDLFGKYDDRRRWILHPSGTRKSGHPNEKPIAVINRLLRVGTCDQDTVVDPFCGSGTTVLCARDMGRKAIGIEIEERWCEVAAKRLAQGVLFT